MTNTREDRVPLLARMPKKMKEEYTLLCRVTGSSIANDVRGILKGRTKELWEQVEEEHGKDRVEEIKSFLASK